MGFLLTLNKEGFYAIPFALTGKMGCWGSTPKDHPEQKDRGKKALNNPMMLNHQQEPKRTND
jgi:hypothetical protein